MPDILKGMAIRDLKEQKLITIITEKDFYQNYENNWECKTKAKHWDTKFTDQVLLMPFKVFEDWNKE